MITSISSTLGRTTTAIDSSTTTAGHSTTFSVSTTTTNATTTKPDPCDHNQCDEQSTICEPDENGAGHSCQCRNGFHIIDEFHDWICEGQKLYHTIIFKHKLFDKTNSFNKKKFTVLRTNKEHLFASKSTNCFFLVTTVPY